MAKGSNRQDEQDVPPILKHPSLEQRARVVGPCVVLAPLDQRLSDDLLSTLDTADLSPRVEHSPHLAMAEACLLRRESRQLRSTGATTAPAPLILLSDPDDQTETMLSAMTQHVPDIPIMRYEQGALHVVTAPHTTDQTDEPPVVIQPPRTREVTDDELASLLPGSSRQHGS